MISLNASNETALWSVIDDDVDDEMMDDGNGRRGNVVCGRILHLEYGMAVGSSKISYGSWFLVLFSLSLVCEIEDKGQWWGYCMSFRYSFALLSSLKKSEASVVVRPVKVVSFLSCGTFARVACDAL